MTIQPACLCRSNPAGCDYHRCSGSCENRTYTAVPRTGDITGSGCGASCLMGNTGKYACSADYYFNDTLPQGSVVRSIALSAVGTKCNSGTNYLNNNVTILPAFPRTYSCQCSDCQTFQTTPLSSQAGFLGYIAGAQNYVHNGQLCAWEAKLTVTVSTCVTTDGQ